MKSKFFREANVYCPDCNEMLFLTGDHCCYCEKCKKASQKRRSGKNVVFNSRFI